MKYKLLTLSLFVAFLVNGFGQTDTTSTKIKVTHTALPFAFYLPETSLGFGGLGIISMRDVDGPENQRPSQVLYSVSYTLRDQLLIYLPYKFYLDTENIRLNGELGYYRYYYQFYGLGPDSKIDDKESYNVNFPRIEFNYFRRLKNNHFGEIGFKYDYFDIFNVKEDGIIARENLAGRSGGDRFRFVFGYLYDNRDNEAFPEDGFYFSLIVDKGIKNILSSYDYNVFVLDGRSFHKLGDELVLANQLYFSNASSNTPFYYLPRVSTKTLARGYGSRRFIDYTISNLQSELRFPLYKRLKGAAFISASQIGDELTSSSLKFTLGAGGRFILNKEDRTRVRADIGLSDEGINFYFTISEAF
ncbi:MAG: outer membrane protein assembly factor BamA [Patiriisocius sp.]|jgi:outer membrane protein assembly factor BamA